MNSLIFLSRSLAKLLSQCTRKQTKIRDACKIALDHLRCQNNTISTNTSANNNHLATVENGAISMTMTTMTTMTMTMTTAAAADICKYFLPLKLACESRSSKMVEIALDSIQKLMAFGYIDGTTMMFEQRPLIDVIVETTCNCFEVQDENVQLQIIKALLTGVSSVKCDVHGKGLRLAVKTCFNIHLVSKSQVNQTTAKATLTQMLNIIFQRMESRPSPPKRSESASSLNSNTATPDSVSCSSASSTIVLVPPDIPQSNTTLNTNHFVHSTVEVGPSSDFVCDGDPMIIPVSEDDVSVFESATFIPNEIVAGTASEEVEVRMVINEIIDSVLKKIDSTHPVEEDSAPETPTRKLQLTEDGNSNIPEDTSSDMGDIPPPNFHLSDQRQIDSFLLFRALCRLSMKPLPNNTTSDTIEMRSRMLSLELILSILDNSGPVFRSSESFIAAIKQYLCLSLLKNCVSPISSIFRLSLSIFLMLISHFKDHLKSEIGIFFTNVFLRILESPNSTYQHKLLVMQVVHRICQDPQTLVDLFVNYDCDLDSTNIYESILNDISKVTQPSAAESGWIATNHETNLKFLRLECLVTILRSLVDWLDNRSSSASVSAAPTSPVTNTLNIQNGDKEDDSTSEGDVSESRDALLLAVPITPTVTSTASPDVFERQKQIKAEIERGVVKFNMKPKKGLEYLIERGHIQNTAQDIARFLYATEDLNKTMIGEYIGEGEQFHKEVLYAFVDLMDFANMGFVAAIRHFLSTFRLPGEAQKIDRIMEKFAERYCHCNNKNNTMFASTDTAYVLAYSVIMLNTDQHSPMLRRRMTLEEFINNNRGIDDGKNLPVEFLTSIYEEIHANEIMLTDDAFKQKEKLVDESFVGAGGSFISTPRKKQILYSFESEMMVRKIQNIFSTKFNTQRTSNYHVATEAEHVRPMFEVSWAPVLAALSINLEETEDPRFIQQCVLGLEYGIHISSRFHMDIQRNTFVSTLSKFTYLTTETYTSSTGVSAEVITSTKEIRYKNIECIKTLIKSALNEGNFLQGSWLDILRCVSQLERLHLIASGAKPDYSLLMEDRGRSPTRRDIPSEQHRRARTADLSGSTFEDANSRNVASAIDGIMIDKLFSKSSDLNSDAIVDFVINLCTVSREEIFSSEPRTFSLQKLIEVAWLNMSRIRLVWTQIWARMAEHFTSICLHDNLSIGMYAIDSLRQLAMKFLEKDELAHYQFQRDFLKPFCIIMTNSTSLRIRELIVRCVQQMILARAANIRSGWKNILQVLTMAANDRNEQLVSLAFETTNRLVREHFPLLADNVVDVVNCLTAFVSNQATLEMSIATLEHGFACACDFASGHNLPPRSNHVLTTTTTTTTMPTTPAQQVFSPSTSSSSKK